MSDLAFLGLIEERPSFDGVPIGKLEEVEDGSRRTSREEDRCLAGVLARSLLPATPLPFDLWLVCVLDLSLLLSVIVLLDRILLPSMSAILDRVLDRCRRS